MTVFTLHILKVLVHSLPKLEEQLSCTCSQTGCKREAATLPAKFVILWEVPEQLWFTPTHSYSQTAQSRRGAVLAILGGIVRAAASPADGQQGSRRLWNGQKKSLRVHIPILHALNYPSCLLQQKLADLDRALLLQHPQPNVPLTPSCITEACMGTKQCLPHKEALTVLSARCFNAKNAGMAEHVSVFQMSQI